MKLVKSLKIKHFRDVFMKDELPQKVRNIACVILNLQNTNERGSYWVAYYKYLDKKYYFDAYGNAPLPKELVKNLGAKYIVF